MAKLILSLFVSLTLIACQFDLSPWETDVHCPNMSVEENLAWLQRIESNTSEEQDFKAAVIGDPQQYPGDLESTIYEINKRDDIDFVLLLGDLVETGIEKEFEWSCKALSKTEKPVFAVIGNHDALSYGKTIWSNVFGDFDYSFTYKGVKFIAYNDNQYEFEDVPDREWLANQASVNENEIRRLTIGMSHIEPWGRDPELSAFLKEQGFDHMLHAHNHNFSYWQQATVGLPHFITADTRGVKYAVLSVNEQQVYMEQCDESCSESKPYSR